MTGRLTGRSSLMTTLRSVTSNIPYYKFVNFAHDFDFTIFFISDLLVSS